MSTFKNPNDTYEIRISETQRMFLMTALIACINRNYLGASSSERKEIDLLTSMLDELPNIPDTHNVTHGFCL